MKALTLSLTLASLLAVSAVAQPPSPPSGGPMMRPGMKVTEPKAVADMGKKAEAAQKKHQAKPKDAKLKKAAAEAWYQYGHAQMVSAELPPFYKYRASHKSLRKALSLDPKHAGAKKDKDMIEGVYKQMGRPIPQD
jgi:hypothetical protein